jgi:hypothetical protein
MSITKDESDTIFLEKSSIGASADAMEKGVLLVERNERGNYLPDFITAKTVLTRFY